MLICHRVSNPPVFATPVSYLLAGELGWLLFFNELDTVVFPYILLSGWIWATYLFITNQRNMLKIISSVVSMISYFITSSGRSLGLWIDYLCHIIKQLNLIFCVHSIESGSCNCHKKAFQLCHERAQQPKTWYEIGANYCTAAAVTYCFVLHYVVFLLYCTKCIVLNCIRLTCIVWYGIMWCSNGLP